MCERVTVLSLSVSQSVILSHNQKDLEDGSLPKINKFQNVALECLEFPVETTGEVSGAHC